MVLVLVLRRGRRGHPWPEQGALVAGAASCPAL